ncbi:hypothetical protein SBV1_gp28 [Sulfolobales Beppu virus 1]|nr:hypothetical protein SBV1_gp28 [Sulfolobales Beppu virus 1]
MAFNPDFIKELLKQSLAQSGVKSIEIVGHKKTFKISIDLVFKDKDSYERAMAMISKLNVGNIDQFAEAITNEIKNNQKIQDVAKTFVSKDKDT